MCRMYTEINRKQRRIERAVQSDPRLAVVQAAIDTPENRAKLKAQAESGRPPIIAVSAVLQATIPAELLAQHSVRTFAGLVVAAILAEDGYQAVGSVRLRNQLFGSAARFRRVHEA